MAETKVTPYETSNPFRWRVYRNAAANSGNGAFAKVSFDTETLDPNNNFTGGTYTCPVPGDCQVNWSIQFASNSTDCLASLYKNGVEVARGSRAKGVVSLVGSSGSDIVTVATNDTLDIYAYTGTTTALDVVGTAGNYFSGVLINKS